MVDDLQSSEESAFVSEEVDRIIEQSVELYLKEKPYDEGMVPHWIDQICESTMSGLTDLNKPFKYVVSCVIMQKNGAGIHSANSCFGDSVTDGAHTVKWPSDKHKDRNRFLYCIVTVFGLGF
jgi:dynein light chain Tctex-type 1